MDQGLPTAPSSARRGLSTKLSRFIDFFEKGPTDSKAPLAVVADLPQAPSSARILRKDSSVKDIIRRFDPNSKPEPTNGKSLPRKSSLAAEETPLKRSHTAASVTSSVCSRSQWVQVDRVIGGKTVSKVWKRKEIELDDEDEPARLDDLIGAPGFDEPSTPVATCEAHVAPMEAEQGAVTVTFDTIGEEEDEDVSSTSDNSSRLIGTNRKDRQQYNDSSRAKRASHFVAIRINDPLVVESVKRFQDELCTAAPFLEECKSNANKLHLTLLVLSLCSADLPAAKAAIQQGVRAFMKAKSIMMRGFHPQKQEPEGSSGFVQSPSPVMYNETQSEIGDEPLRLDFRTIGAFGSRLLFLSPPLRQRLLLQSFHVELARAFGEQGVIIVGAGCGWNSAMAIKNQVLHGRPTVEDEPSAPPPVAPPITRQKSVETAQAKVPSPPIRQQNATPLDKALLRHYDLSSARTSLYIPQLALFKVSKAAKRSKLKSQYPSRLKLFPRLYHNLVQRVLTYGLPPPRGKTGHLQVHGDQSFGETTPGSAIEFSADSTPFPSSAAGVNSMYMTCQHQRSAESPYRGMGVLHQQTDFARPPPPPYEASPSSGMVLPAYMRRPVDGWMGVRPQDSPLYFQSSSPALYGSAFQQQAYPNIASVVNYPPPASGYGFAPNPGGAIMSGGYYPPFYTPNGQPQHQQQQQQPLAQQRGNRGRDLKMITTSWLPEPPFGSQEVMTVDLLEMSQMDADGYYKRLLSVELTEEADICFDLQAQLQQQAAAEKSDKPMEAEEGEESTSDSQQQTDKGS